MIKKALLLSLSLFIAPVAFADSEMDEVLKSIGLVDSQYRYTNDKLATEFFRVATNQYAQSLPVNINSYVQIYSAMMTPYYGNFEAIITLPLTDSEREVFIQELTSLENLQQICLDYYVPNNFMAANNYTLVYSYSDQNYRPLAKLTMNTDKCLNAFTY